MPEWSEQVRYASVSGPRGRTKELGSEGASSRSGRTSSGLISTVNWTRQFAEAMGSGHFRQSRIPKCPDADERHSTTHSCKSGYLAGLCALAVRSTEVIHRRSACNFLRSVAKMPCAALPAHAAAILFAARCAHAQQRSALPMVQLAGQLWGSSDGNVKIPANNDPHWPCTALLAQSKSRNAEMLPQAKEAS